MKAAILKSFASFNESIINCNKCSRLVGWREEISVIKRKAFRDQDYWGRPVPGFGDPHARVLVVGLAPGAHGSNRTGRMFTGDSSGGILYRNLFQYGFANQPVSESINDGLNLRDIYITAVCKCVPPQNKPSIEEIGNCTPFLVSEMEMLERFEGIVVLGRVAYDTIRVLLDPSGEVLDKNRFIHGNLTVSSKIQYWVLQLYHPSRQNTQTGRLSEEMFSEIWKTSRSLLK